MFIPRYDCASLDALRQSCSRESIGSCRSSTVGSISVVHVTRELAACIELAGQKLEAFEKAEKEVRAKVRAVEQKAADKAEAGNAYNA